MRYKGLFGLLLLVVACSYAPEVRTFVRKKPLLSETVEAIYFRVQVFALYDREVAAHRARELKVLQDEPVMVVFKEPYWKVVVGDFSNRLKAAQVRNELINLGYMDAWLVEVKEADLVLEKKYTY